MVKKAAEARPNHLLRAARKDRNWTQKEVAERIGSPRSFNVSRWEQGTAFPSAHYIQQLCLLFGKSARELGLLLEESASSSEPSTGGDTSPLWTVPFRRNPFFTGREGILEHLHDRLTATRTAALTQTQAISGLGGIGKTQIAIEYAYRYREEYRAVFWVRAAKHETLLTDFVELANLLQLPGSNQQDQQIILTTVKRWLEHRHGWLLILDNADDLDLVTDFLPTGDKGYILLTTRSLATGRLAPSIEVEKMSQQEGALLLLRRAKALAPGLPVNQAPGGDRSLAESLVWLMDGLPLALDQAGAYIEETDCSLAGYIDLYHTHRKQLLQRRGGLLLDHPESVTATWALSFLKVEQANPAAADLLRLCAFLDPDAIPEEIFTNGATELGHVLGLVAADPLRLNEAIQELRRFSLIKRDSEAKLLNIHRLVQAVLKDSLDEQMQRGWAERAVRAVNAVFPGEVVVEVAIWSQCQRYLSQTQACAALVDQHGFTFPEAAHLLDRTGHYLRERGLYEQAESLYQRSLTISKRALGPEHPATATTLNNLALLYRNQGRYEEAEPLYHHALAIQERLFGLEHPVTADTLNNLGFLYDQQGKYEEAEPLFQRALAINECLLGPEHPATADTLNNLGYLYGDQGRYEEAEPLYKRALTIQERLFGLEHPASADTLNNLGYLYIQHGRYEEAELFFQHALAIRERVLGPEHPYTATTLNNLGYLYDQQGKYEEAELFFQRALVSKERVLGPEHPAIAASLDSLALLYDHQGRYEEAELLYQRALAINERVLGLEHPSTVATLNNLALLYDHRGRYDEAEPLYQRALHIREQVLGLTHPDTVAVRESYTDLLEKMNQSSNVTRVEDPD